MHVLNESSVFRPDFCALHRKRHLGTSWMPVIHMAGLEDDVFRALRERRDDEIYSAPSRSRPFLFVRERGRGQGAWGFLSMCLSARRQVPGPIHGTLFGPAVSSVFRVRWVWTQSGDRARRDYFLVNVHWMSGVALRLGRCDSFIGLLFIQEKEMRASRHHCGWRSYRYY